MEFTELEKKIMEFRNKIKKFPKYSSINGGNIEEIDNYRNELVGEYNEILDNINQWSANGTNVPKDRYETLILSFKLSEIDIEKSWLRESQKRTDKQIEELQTVYKDIYSISSNLYSFFGLIVGLLAFIFINYQFISSAKDLGIGKMLMFMGIANVGLILGIFLILGILGDLLGQTEKLKNSLRIMKSGWLFLGIIAIIVLGFSIDLFDRTENNKTIDKQIQGVQETQMRHYEELFNELDKRDIENEKLKNEIEALRNEIENLKNKE